MDDSVASDSSCVSVTQSGDSYAAGTTGLVDAASRTGSADGFSEGCSTEEQSEGQSTTVFQDGPPQDDTPPGLGIQRDEGSRWKGLIGQTVSCYRIESLLGRGSMARVYKARHLGLDRDCALKIMDPRLISRHPSVREQFWAEARAAANVVHPHVVAVNNLGVDRGYHFIEMEFVPGAVVRENRWFVSVHSSRSGPRGWFGRLCSLCRRHTALPWCTETSNPPMCCSHPRAMPSSRILGWYIAARG